MTKTAPARGVPIIRKGPPEIAIEWIDVTIDIRVSHPLIHPEKISRVRPKVQHMTILSKVCGLELPPEERGYTSLFPRLDEKLISSDVIDLR